MDKIIKTSLSVSGFLKNEKFTSIVTVSVVEWRLCIPRIQVITNLKFKTLNLLISTNLNLELTDANKTSGFPIPKPLPTKK